jgi:hypothetical protein
MRSKDEKCNWIVSFVLEELVFFGNIHESSAAYLQSAMGFVNMSEDMELGLDMLNLLFEFRRPSVFTAR